MVKYLTSYDLLTEQQFGFSFTRSTADVLRAIKDYVYQAVDNNGEALGVALDISKILDRFWNYDIIRRLRIYSIEGRFFDLIQS